MWSAQDRVRWSGRDKRDERHKVAMIIRKALYRKFPSAPRRLLIDFSVSLSQSVHAYIDDQIRKDKDEKVNA